MDNKKIQIQELFQYRNLWMGIAIIWVVLYHAALVFPSSTMSFIKGIGYGGVDIFLFASGLGCYYSLEKDSDAVNFLRRRFWKTMPTYWIFIVVWLIFKILTDGMPIRAIIGNFFCLQGFIGFDNSFNWYMGAIWLFYFMTPFFKSLVDKTKYIWQMIGLVTLLVVISTVFWRVEALVIIATRVPIFFMGMCLGKLGKEGKNLPILAVLCSIIGVFAGIEIYKWFCTNYFEYLWAYGFYWYPFILITPGLCLIISFIFKYIKIKPIEKVLGFIGENSFEIYLVHILVFNIYSYILHQEVVVKTNENTLIAICFILPCSLFLKWFVKKVLLLVKKANDY